MTGSSKKRILGILVNLIVLVVGTAVISNMVEEFALKDAQAQSEFATETTMLNDHLKASKVRAEELIMGPVAVVYG